jgi:hypothetical protein
LTKNGLSGGLWGPTQLTWLALCGGHAGWRFENIVEVEFRGEEMKRLTVLVLFFATLALAACGAGLSGTYSSGDQMSYTFESNGKVIQDMGGMKIETKYELDGKNIKLITPAGNAVLTLVDDNTISGPMGIKFIKKK